MSLWDDPWLLSDTAERQDKLSSDELAAWKDGKPHQAFEAYRSLVNLADPDTLLDVGCGCGYYADVVAPRDYCGVDFSEAMIAIAKRKYLRDGVEFFTASADALPFRSKQFDCVSFGGLIGHIENWQPVVGELVRVAKRHLLLHRIRAYQNPERPTHDFVKACYGVMGAERGFDESYLLGLIGGELVGDPIRWGKNDDGMYMLSCLVEL